MKSIQDLKKSKPIVFLDIFVGIILIAILLLVIFLPKTQKGGIAEIYRNDILVASLPLAIDTQFEFENNGYTNSIRIEKGSVFVSSADCPDKVCVHTKAIDGKGQAIFCLPSGLKIIVVGKASEVDGEV